MHWKFPTNFLGSGQAQNSSQEIPTQSWYPLSVVGSSNQPPSSSRPSTSSSSSSASAHQKSSDRQQSPYGQPSPSEAAGIVAQLKDKSVDELRRLLTDEDAYNSFFHSLEQVKIQNNLRDELQKETLQLARENLDKEPRILELRNQCQIIRTTELAAAQEKLGELMKQKEEILKFYSPISLLQKLQNAMNKGEEESEILYKQLVENQIDLSAFVQRYKKLRTIYHRRALVHLAARTSLSDA